MITFRIFKTTTDRYIVEILFNGKKQAGHFIAYSQEEAYQIGREVAAKAKRAA